MSVQTKLICPRCGSVDVHVRPGVYSQADCISCAHSWNNTLSSRSSRKRAIENELVDKKQKRQILIRRYYALQDFLRDTIPITDIVRKHNRMKYVDKEFAEIAKTKFVQYFPMTEYVDTLITEYYETYLNHRAKRMIDDIERILFYFVRKWQHVL